VAECSEVHALQIRHRVEQGAGRRYLPGVAGTMQLREGVASVAAVDGGRKEGTRHGSTASCGREGRRDEAVVCVCPMLCSLDSPGHSSTPAQQHNSSNTNASTNSHAPHDDRFRVVRKRVRRLENRSFLSHLGGSGTH
jgi:hypothetical protein